MEIPRDLINYYSALYQAALFRIQSLNCIVVNNVNVLLGRGLSVLEMSSIVHLQHLRAAHTYYVMQANMVAMFV